MAALYRSVEDAADVLIVEFVVDLADYMGCTAVIIAMNSTTLPLKPLFPTFDIWL